MIRPTEEGPARVPETAKQAGDVRQRWDWAEPAVWTERMLTTLEAGVKGGHAFFAEHGLYSLTAAHAQVCRSSSEVNH